MNEVLSAVLLSAASLAIAWSAYQSNLWSGDQSFLMADANMASQRAGTSESMAMQRRQMDGIVFIAWVQARATGREELMTFYRDRFSADLDRAFRAWESTNPFESADAPPHPLAMPEYGNDHIEDAVTARAELADKLSEARLANMHSDRYVLMTVIFASVLFLLGIAQKFDSVRVRNGLTAVGGLILVVGLAFLTSFPVAILD